MAILPVHLLYIISNSKKQNINISCFVLKQKPSFTLLVKDLF